MARIPNIAWFLEAYRKHECGIRDKDPQYYWWITLDHPMLVTCKDYPAHSDYCEVYAKVALVNRMYSAQLGRGMVKKYKAEDDVAAALCKSDIDKFIEPLLDLDTLSETGLSKVVECHSKLVKIVRKGAKNDALSFSSKYLSFHVPRVVPILDSRAAKSARQILKGISSFRGYGTYETHCRRILVLINLLGKEKIKPKVKFIDYVLYSAPST
jgi:hypothetical protein